MGRSKLQVLAALCGAVSWTAGAAAQGMADRPLGHDHAHAHAASAQGNYGELSFPNSGNKTAQAPFLRGVKLLHNFQYEDAVEAFQAAQKADPDFALAYWGEAMAHNYTLWAEQ